MATTEGDGSSQPPVDPVSGGEPAATGPAPGSAGDDSSRRAALGRVRRRLLDAGATPEEIDRAIDDDVLDLLAVDLLFVPAPHRYSEDEVSARTGLDPQLLQRFWRALGFVDMDADERLLTDLDIEAAQLFQAIVALGAADVETAVQMARVIGSSMARIAEAEVAPGPMRIDTGGDSVEAADDFVRVADTTLPAMARLLEFVWRRHVQAATRRTMLLRAHGSASGLSPTLVVGFADMVGFTLLSQHLTADELAAVVRRFEEISHDTVTGLGGRVVKMIGDEVMFVVDSVVAGVRIALDLAEAYADDDLLSDVRVGLAYGTVLLRDGDYYGTTVNLAHRIVNIANPGTVITSDAFHDELMTVAGDEFTGQPLRPRSLKGLGRVQLWWAGRRGHAPVELDGAGSGADRRRNVRWERLAEVLRDLEDLRDAGERLLTGSGRRPAGPAPQPLSGAGQPDGGDAEGP